MSEGSREGTQMPDLSGMLGALLANPQALSTVASLLGGALNRPNETEGGAPTPPPTPPSGESETRGTRPLPAARDPRRGLLDALRPYLSPARCDMIDTLLRILELLALLQKRR